MTSQPEQELIRQQQLLMYLDTVLLDFDNENEIQKILSKLKKVKVLPKLPKRG